MPDGSRRGKNPSEFMLNGKPKGASGSVVACSMEGTRPILIEVQALVCRSNFGIPRRTAAGTDFNRVNLLMAVLEKRGGMNLSDSDAYVNIAGGIKMTEPAIDLGILLAIASSYRDIVIPESVVAFWRSRAERGSTGSQHGASACSGGEKLGFETVILPKVCRSAVKEVTGIRLIFVESIKDAISAIK